jgi:hypothetical protein
MTPSNESARRNSQARRPTADHAFAARGGRHRVGSVVERHGKFLTYDNDDLNVGEFATLRDATRALPAAQKSTKRKEKRGQGREERSGFPIARRNLPTEFSCVRNKEKEARRRQRRGLIETLLSKPLK